MAKPLSAIALLLAFTTSSAFSLAAAGPAAAETPIYEHRAVPILQYYSSGTRREAASALALPETSLGDCKELRKNIVANNPPGGYQGLRYSKIICLDLVTGEAR